MFFYLKIACKFRRQTLKPCYLSVWQFATQGGGTRVLCPPPPPHILQRISSLLPKPRMTPLRGRAQPAAALLAAAAFMVLVRCTLAWEGDLPINMIAQGAGIVTHANERLVAEQMMRGMMEVAEEIRTGKERPPLVAAMEAPSNLTAVNASAIQAKVRLEPDLLRMTMPVRKVSLARRTCSCRYGPSATLAAVTLLTCPAPWPHADFCPCAGHLADGGVELPLQQRSAPKEASFLRSGPLLPGALQPCRHGEQRGLHGGGTDLLQPCTRLQRVPVQQHGTGS